MARSFALLLLAAGAACMEMRETVERMVMVRTTGSDLQPAATGYIYKKESDGPASVIEMGESEVMEHLSKLYEQPKAFAAPIPVAAGPFYAKEEDEKLAAYSSETKVIPVVEDQDQENKDDHIDGIASEDYGKIFGEYASDFGDYKSDFDDYLKSLRHFDNGLYHEHGGGKDYGLKGHHEHGDNGHKGFGTKHHYEKGGTGDYHSEKYESYKISGGGGLKNYYGDDDDYGKHYAHGHKYDGGDHGYKTAHIKGAGIHGFHNLFDKNDFKKDHDFYDGEGIKGGFHKFGDGHAHHGSGAGGYEDGGSHISGHHDGGFGKEGFYDKHSGDEHAAAHSGEEGGNSFHHHHGDFGSKGGEHDGDVFGYEVKH